MTRLIDKVEAPPPRQRLPKVVRVNGVAIGRDAISREAQNHPADGPQGAWTAAATALVVRELLLQEARRLGVAAEPIRDDDGRRETEEEAAIRALVEREVRVPSAEETACRRYYDNNRRRFCTASLDEVRHILIVAAPDDAPARTAARRLAADVAAALERDPGAFAGLARELSACPSKTVGGNLGQIGPGQTVPELETALAAMTPGRVHPEPVETRYGVHVVEVVRRIEGRELPFEAVRERIAGYLEERVRRRALHQYVALLVGRADIEGIDVAGVASPLVQ